MMRSQAAQRRVLTAHTPLRPILTHLHPATSEHQTQIVLPAHNHVCLYPPAPPTEPLTHVANTVTACALTHTGTVITAHRSGHLYVHTQPAITIRPFRDERVITHVVLDASNTYMAVASADGRLHVYRVDGMVITHVLLVQGYVTVLRFQHDTGCDGLFVGMEDGIVNVFRLQDKRRDPFSSFSPHVSRVVGVVFVDGLCVSVAHDGVMALSHMQRLKCTNTTLLQMGERVVGIVNVGGTVVTAGERGVLRVWDVMQKCEKKDLALRIPFVKTSTGEEEDEGVCVSNIAACGGERVVVTLSDQTVLFFGVEEGTLVLEKEVLCGNMEEIYDVSCVAENEYAVASNSESLWIMQANPGMKDGKKIGRGDVKNDGLWTSRARLQGHDGIILSVACLKSEKVLKDDPADAYVATSARDNSARVWRRRRGRWDCMALAEGHTDAVGAVALSPRIANGQFFIVTGGADRTLKLWSLDAAKKVIEKGDDDNEDADEGFLFGNEGEGFALSAKWTVLAHRKDVNAVAISPDAKLVATGSQDRILKLWKTENGEAHATCTGHKRGIWNVCFSTVDKVVASASGDATIRIWNVADGTCLRSLQGHLAGVLNARFLSNGTQIVSSGADGLLKLWSSRSGECDATFEAHDDRAWAVDVVNDGAVVVSGGADGLLQMWDDCTAGAVAEVAKEKQQEALMSQMVMNATRAKQWSVAARGALKLGMGQKVKGIFSELILTADKPEDEIMDVVKKLTDVGKKKGDDETDKDFSDVAKLLLFCRDWNASGGATSAAVAAYVLQGVFSVFTPSALCDGIRTDVRSLVEGLHAHATRHLNRIAGLGMRVCVMEHTLDMMKALPDVNDVSGCGKENDVVEKKRKRNKKDKDVSKKGVKRKRKRREEVHAEY